jgi:hypothetical protein
MLLDTPLLMQGSNWYSEASTGINPPHVVYFGQGAWSKHLQQQWSDDIYFNRVAMRMDASLCL